MKASDILAAVGISLFAIFTLAQAADTWKFNPFTGKLDNVGDDPVPCVDIFDGKNATFRISTTATLAAGSNATVRNDGTLSDGILKFGIPQGADGAQGETGGTVQFSVGLVETLVPGSSAYVNYSCAGLACTTNYGIPKGDAGDPGTITQDNIFTEIEEQTTAPLTLWGVNNTDAKFIMQFPGGQTSLYMTSSGLLFAQDINGKISWGWDNDNEIMVFSHFSAASSRKNMTIDRFGQMKRYAPNGTTLIYESYTTGRTNFYNKRGASIMKLYSSRRVEI